MDKFYIHENNMERLAKQLNTIQKKCEAAGASFHYEILGEEVRQYEDASGKKYLAKFYEVEVEGSLKHENWEFVATIDHHKEGNIIRKFNTELVVPEKYKTCGPTCEHCNKIRSRKDTYLIYNTETDEFKQVGKSCMKEYTSGLDAEQVAWLVSIYDKLEAGYYYSGSGYIHYLEVKEVLQYAFETYRKFGYEKAYDDYGDLARRSTRSRVSDYMRYYSGRLSLAETEAIEAELDEVSFDPKSDYAVNSTEAALEWLQNVTPEERRGSEYIDTLHILSTEEYTESRNFGILVSIPVAYDRHIKKEEEKKQKEAAHKEDQVASEFVGQPKERITINASEFHLITSFDNLYGTSYLYTWKEDGNVFIWYSSNYIDDPEEVNQIVGTVKEHTEFRGVKQTVMTRCKVTSRIQKEETK